MNPTAGAPDGPPDAGLVRAAHADAWAQLARARPGGAVAELPGVRLASSGLPHPQFNGADLVDPALADPGAVAAWFAGQGVPWAWRTPPGLSRPPGRLVVAQRLMAVRADGLRSAAPPAGAQLRSAGPEDLEDVVAVDVTAFGGAAGQARAWIAPHLAAGAVRAGVQVCLARVDGRAVGTAYAVRSDGAAGPAVLLAGVGVVPDARGRGLGAALSSWLLARAVAAGARLAHLQPDDERAARVYARLGFAEVDGLEVRAPEEPAAGGGSGAGPGG
ncbi:GNAT family N-acetyltransferase [Kineococcus sp. SYSU DK004]|uniref:GNAT family N-acetyltransferase n=1 Tax=Kineococcus sp. SYSU DK004 TaxID=3383125 RepID=UPI003D7E5CAE